MEKQRWEESERRRAQERKGEKKEDAGARKGWKIAKHYVFPLICGSGGSKSRLAKAAGAEPSGQMRDEAHFEVKSVKKTDSLRPLLQVELSKKCTPLWREAHFQAKMYKTHHSRS